MLDAGKEAVCHLDGVLGLADEGHQAALLAGRCRGEFTATVELLFRLAHGDFCHVWVIGDGVQRARVVLLQLCQNLLGLRDAGAHVHAAAREFVQFGIGVDQQIAHGGEIRGLGIQGIIGLATRGDDLDEHLAALGLGFWRGVVKPALHSKGLLQGGGGVVHRAGERTRALGAELGGGDVELLLAAANGLIGRDQLLARQGFERCGIKLIQRVRIARLDGAR